MSERRPRDASVEALRAALTILVVLHHTAITYGAAGSWYLYEIPHSGALSSQLLSVFTAVNQAFFMGLFFLIAGYFTPGAVARHGAVGFLLERNLRLALPLVVYLFLIGPATIALVATSKGRPFLATLLTLWRNGVIDIGPLWFCEALLYFSCAFVVVSRFYAPPSEPRFPSNAKMAAAALATGAAAFALRLGWPTGTAFIGLPLGFFASYVVLFAAGCAAAAWPSLDAAPKPQRRLWGAVSWIALPMLPITAIVYRRLTGAEPNFSGGLSIPGLVYAFWEPFLAWGVILALLHVFHRRFANLGAFARFLARHAYAVYVIHPPILVAIALAWASVPAPALLKFSVTGGFACVACWAMAGLMLRIPLARRAL